MTLVVPRPSDLFYIFIPKESHADQYKACNKTYCSYQNLNACFIHLFIFQITFPENYEDTYLGFFPH